MTGWLPHNHSSTLPNGLWWTPHAASAFLPTLSRYKMVLHGGQTESSPSFVAYLFLWYIFFHNYCRLINSSPSLPIFLIQVSHWLHIYSQIASDEPCMRFEIPYFEKPRPREPKKIIIMRTSVSAGVGWMVSAAWALYSAPQEISTGPSGPLWYPWLLCSSHIRPHDTLLLPLGYLLTYNTIRDTLSPYFEAQQGPVILVVTYTEWSNTLANHDVLIYV